MIRVAYSMALAAVAACSVPGLELEGKQCPCADGYTCDTATNTCHAMLGGDGPNIDADGDGPMPDSSPGSCIGGTTGALLYGTAFTQGNLQWTEPLGDWSVVGGEAHQNDAAIALGYAFPDQTATETNYRLTAKLRQLSGSGTDAVGLLLRAQTTNDGNYACDWQPSTGRFAISVVSTAGAPTELSGIVVDTAAIPGYLPTDAQIMDGRANGSMIECCIRGMPTAHLMITDTTYATGGPGFRTASMSAAYDDLAINGL
jgi:hypothetical protein